MSDPASLAVVPFEVPGYPALFLLCAASGLILPFPEDVPLLYAGIRVHDGEASWWPTVAAAMAGVFLRDSFGWWTGRAIGGWLLERPWTGRILGRKRLKRARDLVERHGASAVLVGRFLVGIRFSVFFAAGAMGVRGREFFLYDLIGLLVTVPAVIAVGYQFGAPLLGTAIDALEHSRGFAALVLVAGAVYLGWRTWRPEPDASGR
jgi:membrane-associated protein